MEDNKHPYLEPCPFCGEDEALTSREVYEAGEPLVDEHGYMICYVECLPCDVRTGNFYESDYVEQGYKKEDARLMSIRHWNTRTKPGYEYGK